MEKWGDIFMILIKIWNDMEVGLFDRNRCMDFVYF